MYLGPRQHRQFYIVLKQKLISYTRSSSYQTWPLGINLLYFSLFLFKAHLVCKPVQSFCLFIRDLTKESKEINKFVFLFKKKFSRFEKKIAFQGKLQREVFDRFLGKTSLTKNFQMKSEGVGVGCGGSGESWCVSTSVSRPQFHR